jgi:nicotinamidase-related amidase
MNLELDPSTVALVMIDLQLGILALPLQPHGPGDVLTSCERLGLAFAAAGATIVTVTVGFSPDGGDRVPGLVDQPMTLPAGGLPASWSTLDPRVAALPAAVSIRKHGWSAFYGTDLDLQLRRRGISTIVLCGIATNFGVESTARDAWHHGYSTVVASDCCSSVAPGLHDFALNSVLPRVSRVRGSAEIIAALHVG